LGFFVVQLLQGSERMPSAHAGGGERLIIRQRRLVGLALVLLAAVVVAASSQLHGTAESAVELAGTIIQKHPAWGVFAFVTLAALSAMFSFFSSVVIVPVAAHHWGQVTTVALLWVGWLAGGATTYAIGRFVGSRLARLLVSTGRLEYYEDRLSARAPFWIILLLQLAVPSEIPGYVLGSLKYRFPAYFLALALAEFPFAIGAVFLSSEFLSRRYWMVAVVGIAGIGFLAWVIGRLHRELEKEPPATPGGNPPGPPRASWNRGTGPAVGRAAELSQHIHEPIRAASTTSGRKQGQPLR
jgi:uncharacterized membrane protein YdjX (TVP38/TMEM64 family)